LTLSKDIFVYNIVGNDFIFNKSINIKSETEKPGGVKLINFIPGQNNILLSYFNTGDEPFLNLLIDLKGDIVNKRVNYFKFPESFSGKIGLASNFPNIIYSYNNSLCFRAWYSDTVFTFDQSDKIIQRIILSSDNKPVSLDILADRINNQSNPVVETLMEVPRYILYRYIIRTGTYYKGSFEVYDKYINKKFRITEFSRGNPEKWLKDDIIGGADFEPKFCCDGKLYSWIDALTLKEYFSSDSFKNSVVKNPEKKKTLGKLDDSLKETDNPILIVVTPKK
jgi:hypothetical protein